MHIKLACKQENNENIADIYIFSLYLFIDNKNLCFILIQRENMTRFLHLILFIVLTLKEALPSN